MKTMTHTSTLVLLCALLCAIALGCTSFSFGKKGRGGAPDALKDRSLMAQIPGGIFDMGFFQGEPDEYPPHKVELDTFSIDKTEVTLGDYERCVDAGICHPMAIPDEVRSGMTDKHPAVGMSWFDAKAYCDWVGKRLPTEAEWEYAARAPKMGAFPWEGRFDPTRANTRGAVAGPGGSLSDPDGFLRTAPVGSFPGGASGYGVLDMAGNVAEWVNDWYDATYYQRSTTKNPPGADQATGNKSVRGGSYADNDYLVRSTTRKAAEPHRSNDAIGFRCAG